MRIRVDFRRIARSHVALSNGTVNLATFEEGLVRDGALIVVKSIPLSEFIEDSEIENEIENVLNLRHPLIVTPFRFLSPAESALCGELKSARLYAVGGSLTDVLLTQPSWWTSTAKAKAVAGIVLALRFAHSFGLLHGSLKAENVLFDADHQIQIADFDPMRLNGIDTGGFAGENWTPRCDVSAFAFLLFEILVGRPVTELSVTCGDVVLPTDVPEFVSEMIEKELSPNSDGKRSFIDIFESLEGGGFRILADVDSEDVAEFVNRVQLAEQSGQWE
jgi:serine/threonine protein kinase